MQSKSGIVSTNRKILITFKDLHSELAHGNVDLAGMLPRPIIVPLNLQTIKEEGYNRHTSEIYDEITIYGI